MQSTDAEKVKAPPRIVQPQQTQIQIISLLKTLNERLKITQAERNKMRKELDSYRDLIENLEEKAARSEHAYADLERKLSQKNIDLQAQMLVKETTRELEETRRLILELEDKTERVDGSIADLQSEIGQTKKAGDLVLKKQDLLEQQQKKQAQKLANSTVSYTELSKRLQETEGRQESLSGRVDEALLQQARLTRKVDKTIEERARFMRKIERIEETVIQTRDSLNAKAMVLLTDQAIAAQAALDEDDPSLVNASGSIDPAMLAAQNEGDFAGGQTVDAQKYVRIAGVAAAAVFLVLSGWMLGELRRPDLSDWNFVEKTQDSSGAPSVSTAGAVGKFNPSGELEWEVQETKQSKIVPQVRETQSGRGFSASSVEPVDLMNDIGAVDLENQEQVRALLEENPEAVAMKLNAIEPGESGAPLAEETAAVVAPINPGPPRPGSFETQKQESRVGGEGEDRLVSPHAMTKLDFTPLIFRAVDVEPPRDVITPDPGLSGPIKKIEEQAFEGVATAQHDLAAIYTAGHGVVKQDYERAVLWFRQAAAQKVANANYNLGVFYHQGLGVKPDIHEAIFWYKNAAALGHPEAQYNLGIAYIEGIGVDYDPHRAAAFFTQAATNNIMEAAYNLGLIYENGLLGKSEPAEALMWYKTAADQGSPEAKRALKQLADTLDIKLEDVNHLVDEMRAHRESMRSSPTSPQSASEAVLSGGELRGSDVGAAPPGGERIVTPEESDRIITAQVQEYLMRAGLYPGPADGIRGPLTEDAIRSYQENNDLQVDGLVTKELLSHMLANGE